LFSKIEVNGDSACELYQMLKAAQSDEEGKADIGWNFAKFLVNGDGEVVARFSPMVTPEEIAEQLPGFS
jgi:glutathione peroxidase